MKKQIKQRINKHITFSLSTLLCMLIHSAVYAENGLNILYDIEYTYGLYAIDMIKMLLGIITIIGGTGFFITTSSKRAHWPTYIRRIFFGIFIFCNILFQALFNVINIPNNKKLLCFLGKCINISPLKK